MVFGGQVVQKVELLRLYMPFGQLTQILCPYPVLYVPGEQNKHIFAETFDENLPGTQAIHEVDHHNDA
jgi:hypothetical protein